MLCKLDNDPAKFEPILGTTRLVQMMPPGRITNTATAVVVALIWLLTQHGVSITVTTPSKHSVPVLNPVGYAVRCIQKNSSLGD